jgi:hypothetical protein
LPLPLLPVMVIQEAPLVAVQPQLELLLTETVLLPTLEAKEPLDGVIA